MRQIEFSKHAVSEFAGLFGSCATMLSDCTSRRVASVLLKWADLEKAVPFIAGRSRYGHTVGSCRSEQIAIFRSRF